jgi:hypothetical protein
MRSFQSAPVSLATNPMASEALMRLKRRIQAAIGLILKVGLFLAIAVGGGLFTSWYASTKGLPLTTERSGPWVRWTHSAQLDADPYSIIRNNRLGMLPYSSTFVARYEAITDDAGRRLHSSCHYAIQGPIPNANWWRLHILTQDGRLIANPANRFGFNAATIIDRPDGTFRIDIARDARPGNWLPVPRGGRLVVVLEILNRTGATGVLGNDARALPAISRVSCG